MGFRRVLFLAVIGVLSGSAMPALSADAPNRPASEAQAPVLGSGDPRRVRAGQLLQKRDWPELQRHAQAWVAEDPNNQIAWTYLGDARHWLGNVDGAIEALQRATEINPGY